MVKGPQYYSLMRLSYAICIEDYTSRYINKISSEKKCGSAVHPQKGMCVGGMRGGGGEGGGGGWSEKLL